MGEARISGLREEHSGIYKLYREPPAPKSGDYFLKQRQKFTWNMLVGSLATTEKLVSGSQKTRTDRAQRWCGPRLPEKCRGWLDSREKPSGHRCLRGAAAGCVRQWPRHERGQRQLFLVCHLVLATKRNQRQTATQLKAVNAIKLQLLIQLPNFS